MHEDKGAWERGVWIGCVRVTSWDGIARLHLQKTDKPRGIECDRRVGVWDDAEQYTVGTEGKESPAS